MSELSERAIVCALADSICRHITRKTIAYLQGLTREAMQSGEDSGLENVWDEVCVQIQGVSSILWDLYTDTIQNMLSYCVRGLQPYEREAIWLQTPQAVDWKYEEETERDPYPVYDNDIVEYLLKDYVLVEAGEWSNPRIREYLAHG